MAVNAATLLTGAQALTSSVSQFQQAGAVAASGAYNQRLANWNADMAERQAADAIARGQEAERRQRTATQQTVGAQRAALAASGVDVSSGSAADVQGDTAALGELDALTIRNNAAREAWGYKVEAADERQRGVMAGLAARNEAAALRRAAFSTLLTGAANTYGMSHDGRGPSRTKTARAKPTFGVDSGRSGGYG